MYPHPIYKKYGTDQRGTIFNLISKKELTINRWNQVKIRHEGKALNPLSLSFIFECFHNKQIDSKDTIVFESGEKNHAIPLIKQLVVLNAAGLKIHKEKCRRIKQAHLESEGWVAHPTFINYMANSDGDVYSLYTSKTLVTAPNQDGYIQLSFFDTNMKKTTRYQHVLSGKPTIRLSSLPDLILIISTIKKQTTLSRIFRNSLARIMWRRR